MIARLFFILTILILVLLGGVYGVLFTSTGNSFVASYIEDKVNEGQKDVNMKVNDFKLTMSDILFDASVNDNSTIKIKGNLDLISQVVDLEYNIKIKELSKLQNITSQKLNGPFFTKGTIKGNANETIVKGITDIASSDSQYNIKLVEFNPDDILLTIKGARIDSLLKLIDQPIFAQGFINIDAKIKNADIENLDGKILTKITKGKVNNEIVNKEFDQKLKNLISFDGDIITNLVKTQAISNIDFNTNLANLDSKKAIFDIKNGEFVSDYELNINDLSKLEEIAQQKMRGKIKIAGNVKQTKNFLNVDGKSNIFGGVISFELLNDDFKGNINEVEIKDLSHMLYYPEIFTSKSNIDLDYNLATKIGKVSGNLLQGKFIKNQYSTLINTIAQFDLTKEIYEKVEINSDIKKEIIKSTLNMKSKHTTISVPSSTLNTEKNTIDADVKSKILDLDLNAKVSGDLSNPNIDLDKSVLLKTKVIKEKTEKLKEDVKEKIQEKIGDSLKLDKLLKF